MRSHHQELYETNTLGHHAKTVLQVDHQTHERVQLPILYVNGNKRALMTRVRWKVEQTDIGVSCHGKFFQNLGLCQQEVISRLSPSAQDLNKHFFLCKVSCHQYFIAVIKTASLQVSEASSWEVLKGGTASFQLSKVFWESNISRLLPTRAWTSCSRGQAAALLSGVT